MTRNFVVHGFLTGGNIPFPEFGHVEEIEFCGRFKGNTMTEASSVHYVYSGLAIEISYV